jgi:FAD/FMN-containing dehydrogenase
MIRWARKRWWVWIPLSGFGVVAILLARPVGFLVFTAVLDRDERVPLARGVVDDASRLDATKVDEVWDMPAGDDAEERLRQVLARARREHLCVTAAGARHSMGGQTIYPGGIQVNMLPYHRMSLDEKDNLLDVQAGARWAEVLAFLDARQRSVAVMQSNNTFSVGGSLSVNCHGWAPGRPPIASTVESFRIMEADGTVVRCSRTENAELFSLALGGYGLFGIILDARLRVVPNELYLASQYLMPTGEYLTTWDEDVGRASDVGMAIGRLSIVPEDFLDEAELYTFTRAPAGAGGVPRIADFPFEGLARAMFRGSVDSDYGKRLRWWAETKLLRHIAGRFYSRNQLLNEPAEVLENRSADSRDILQEYFVPRAGLDDFVGRMRVIVPRDKGNLLNVTLRDVREDPDTVLRYADRDMVTLVLLFNQRMTDEGEAQMRVLTRELIDAALADGGRYYLPYRLEATTRQFEEAYPQAKKFFQLKRRYDPGELFQNEFYVKYGSGEMGNTGG